MSVLDPEKPQKWIWVTETNTVPGTRGLFCVLRFCRSVGSSCWLCCFESESHFLTSRYL